jgi:hypothetical protein
MGSYFTYGVFADQTNFAKAFSALSGQGFENITVIKNAPSQLYKSAKLSLFPRRTFLWGGLAGAIIGGIAGAVASPTVPYAGTYQLITPIMSMVSGSIITAYFGVWLCGFLNWIDKPLPADAFEGTIANGSLLLAVETDELKDQQLVMDCLSRSGAVEIIARTEEIGALPTVHGEVALDNQKPVSKALAA